MLCPLTAHQQAVSGSVSLPARGFFSPFPHGTVRYRSLWLFSLGTWSSRLPSGFPVSAGTHVTGPRAVPLGYGALTPSGGPSQGPSPRNCSAHSVEKRSSLLPVRSTPRRHWPTRHWVGVVWALPRSLATTRGISFDFCAGGTEMFPFPPWPPRRVPRFSAAGCPIRTSTDQRVLGPSPSLLAAVLRPSSAPQRLGIHRLLSGTCRSARPRSCDLARHSCPR